MQLGVWAWNVAAKMMRFYKRTQDGWYKNNCFSNARGSIESNLEGISPDKSAQVNRSQELLYHGQPPESSVLTTGSPVSSRGDRSRMKGSFDEVVYRRSNRSTQPFRKKTKKTSEMPHPQDGRQPSP
jgi:hypothetical protein